MSLQVQPSQHPPSGRRTPQVYQNFSTGASATSPTNGNNKTSSSKLSLKASEKTSVVPTTTDPTIVGDKESTQTLVLSINKLPDETTSPSKEVSVKDSNEKVTATNGGSTNGTHKEKASNGNTTENVSTPMKTAAEPSKKEDEKEKKVKQSPRSTPQKQPQPDQETIVSKDATVKKAKEPPSPVTLDQKKKEKPSAENSLVADKVLKGFTAEGEEMESLVVEPSEYEDSPMPPRTGGKSKLLKYGTGPLARARISPFRVNEAAKNASTMVNLSTVSEGQTSVTESNEASPASDYNRSLRTISGRRSTRPLTDIQLTHRRSVELNDSTSSLNVTIGSEIHNDSLRTPAPGSSRKRKAMTPESTSDALDVKEIVDSPKRGRLDLSGLLGIVASPVTMLKNRLSRVRLQARTPVAKRNFDGDNPNSDGVVTAEATTTTANISGEEGKMEVEVIEDPKGEELAKVSGDGGDDKTNTNEIASHVSGDGDSEYGNDAEDGSEQVVVKDVTNKRQFCIVM
ncbi:mucin-2-like [Wyeomyia smithii]|uniref:mucin-2-like n=1 Tax=Wyeomyia smithii TaxID=174621 RepID=UPI002467BEF4|nr:mucin-2-like [Wyeomyia smithii]